MPTLEWFVQHYLETIRSQPNAWGQYISPIYGQSHWIIITASAIYDVDVIEAAIQKAIKAHYAQ